MKRCGYTLIELVIVAVIISVLVITGYAKISSYRYQQLRSAAERIAGDMRFAKEMAAASSKWHGMLFQADPTNSYSIYTTDGAADTNIKFPQYPAQDFIVTLNNDYQGVAISSINIDSGTKVEFDPYGTPYTDKSGAPIGAEGVITLTQGSSTVTVRITPNVGRIYVQ